MSEELDIVRGSDNPFRDAGLDNADVLQAKADLAAAIVGVLDDRGLTVRAAAKLVDVDHADLARIRTADLGRFTVDRLMRILNRLDRRVEVRVSRVRRGRKAA